MFWKILYVSTLFEYIIKEHKCLIGIDKNIKRIFIVFFFNNRFFCRLSNGCRRKNRFTSTNVCVVCQQLNNYCYWFFYPTKTVVEINSSNGNQIIFFNIDQPETLFRISLCDAKPTLKTEMITKATRYNI